MHFVSPKAYASKNKNPKYGVPHKAWGYYLVPTRITVQANQIKVYPKIGHHNTGKGHNTGKIIYPFATKTRNQPHVKHKSIYHNRNQCPSLFGIPSPITSPTLVGPLAA